MFRHLFVFYCFGENGSSIHSHTHILFLSLYFSLLCYYPSPQLRSLHSACSLHHSVTIIACCFIPVPSGSEDEPALSDLVLGSTSSTALTVQICGKVAQRSCLHRDREAADSSVDSSVRCILSTAVIHSTRTNRCVSSNA